VESAPRAYRLKASNAAPPISTFPGATPRTRFEPRYGETDAGKNEPYRVWQTHAPGDDRDENSYAEEANGVSENGVHHFNYSAIGQSAVYFPPALLLTADAAMEQRLISVHGTNRTNQTALVMSVPEGKPEAAFPGRQDRF
jgi:hypothetical protein